MHILWTAAGILAAFATIRALLWVRDENTPMVAYRLEPDAARNHMTAYFYRDKKGGERKPPAHQDGFLRRVTTQYGEIKNGRKDWTMSYGGYIDWEPDAEDALL